MWIVYALEVASNLRIPEVNDYLPYISIACYDTQHSRCSVTIIAQGPRVI